jgi:hypothetical protein
MAEDSKHFSLSKEKTKAFPIVVLLLVAVGGLTAISLLSSVGRSYLDSLSSSLSFHGSKVTLSIGSASKTYKVGDTIDATVVFNPYKKDINEVDAVIKFDPDFVQVVPINAKAATQADRYLETESAVLAKFSGVLMDNQQGTFSFVAATGEKSPAKGAGKIAGLRFKALKPGVTKISFDFTPGSKKDTNVLSANGEDVLEVAQNLQITIN